MSVYSARALVAAACTCVSELAAGSVHSLGEAGGLGMRAIVALDGELLAQREEHKHRSARLSTAAPKAPPSDADGPPLSAGGTTCALGACLLQETGVLVGTYLAAARACRATAVEIASITPLAELRAPLAALEETLDAFEAGLAVDTAEVRAQLTEALRHLLPICSLLQPPPKIDKVQAATPTAAPAAPPVAAPPVAAPSDDAPPAAPPPAAPPPDAPPDASEEAEAVGATDDADKAAADLAAAAVAKALSAEEAAAVDVE